MTAFDQPYMPVELDDLRSITFARSSDAYRVALLIPLCGSAGLWAPSCISGAQIAVAELNEAGGIQGRKVQLIMIDAAREACEPVEEIVNGLIEGGFIDAMLACISAPVPASEQSRPTADTLYLYATFCRR